MIELEGDISERSKSIKAKAEAKAAGEKTYLGKPCAYHPENKIKWTSNGVCVECTKEARKLYIARHKEALVKKRKEWDRKNPVKSMLQRARRRARDLGLAFNLMPEDIQIPNKCPVLGIDLVRGVDTQDNSPSLDRIDNDAGYVRGNVVVVSFRANRIKGNSTMEELRKVLAFYEQNYSKDNRG